MTATLGRQPTFTVLADGTGYCIVRGRNRTCVCVDLPERCDTLLAQQRSALRDRFWYAWRHAKLSK